LIRGLNAADVRVRVKVLPGLEDLQQDWDERDGRE
jgi:hypothetical protein